MNNDADALARRHWDVIVIGTGMGGATVGHALAQDGLAVLFLERGQRVSGDTPQTDPEQPEARLAQGWWPHPISEVRPDGRTVRTFAPMGCAVGGSTVHYGAALERLADEDFAPLAVPGAPTACWPLDAAAFAPHYAAAERLYGVGPASLPDAPGQRSDRISDWDRALRAHLQTRGVDCGWLQVAVRYDAHCTECLGRICPRRCKADARTACLEPALAHPHAALLTGCTVQTLQADAQHVHTVHARLADGTALALSAQVVVLAAGALHTPQVLLRSANAHWPQGLANASGQVGRNLMCHLSDHFALWAPRRLSTAGRQRKALSVRGFYRHEGQRLGYVQSLGVQVERGMVAVVVKNLLRRLGITHPQALRLLAAVPARLAARLLGSANLMAAITEDDPHPDNRIELAPDEPDGLRFHYRPAGDLYARAAALRRAFGRAVRPWRQLSVMPQPILNLAHVCGTCRFGDDPATSVLDRDCRAHGLANLFVVDASFLPRSGAVNPSLTIAANALRVAPAIARAVRAGRPLAAATDPG